MPDDLPAGAAPTARPKTGTMDRWGKYAGAIHFRDVEAVMTAAGGRPHWGKMHTRSADYLRRAYAGFDDFVALRDELDPERRFGDAYLTQVLGS
jgi:L-gulono-1,4-lactone dehydrogenase